MIRPLIYNTLQDPETDLAKQRDWMIVDLRALIRATLYGERLQNQCQWLVLLGGLAGLDRIIAKRLVM
jgi:hypothetical protein